MTKCLDNINVKGLEKWILSFCLFAFLPFHASAIDVKGKKNSAVIDGISYQLNAKKETAIVVKSPDIYSGDIVIPEKIEVDSLTFYVEEIAASAFEKATGVTSISIPKGISKIGPRAFSGCSSLTAIELPKSIEELPTELFSECSSLVDVTLPKSIRSVPFPLPLQLKPALAGLSVGKNGAHHFLVLLNYAGSTEVV